MTILKPPVVSVLGKGLAAGHARSGRGCKPVARGGLEKLPMAFILRLLLAQYLVHLFEGITFDAWLNLLRREQFKIDPVCWPRAAWITALSRRQLGRREDSGAPVWHRDRGHVRGGADLYPGPLPQWHDSSSRAAGDRSIDSRHRIATRRSIPAPSCSPSRGWRLWSSHSCCPAGFRKTKWPTWCLPSNRHTWIGASLAAGTTTAAISRFETPRPRKSRRGRVPCVIF